MGVVIDLPLLNRNSDANVITYKRRGNDLDQRKALIKIKKHLSHQAKLRCKRLTFLNTGLDYARPDSYILGLIIYAG